MCAYISIVFSFYFILLVWQWLKTIYYLLRKIKINIIIKLRPPYEFVKDKVNHQLIKIKLPGFLTFMADEKFEGEEANEDQAAEAPANNLVEAKVKPGQLQDKVEPAENADKADNAEKDKKDKKKKKSKKKDKKEKKKSTNAPEDSERLVTEENRNDPPQVNHIHPQIPVVNMMK